MSYSVLQRSNELELGLPSLLLIKSPESLKGGGRFLMMELGQQHNQTHQQQSFDL
jgi:hypothetical protein